MENPTNWRSSLGATERYENIEKLKKSIEAKGLSSTGTAHKSAFAVESDAYNTSESREAYDSVCNAVINESPTDLSDPEPEPSTPGIPIGKYQNCHHVASGFVAEVYQSKIVALKVITETHKIEPHNPEREVKILISHPHPHIINLIETFKDSEGRLVLVLPFVPLTLAKVIGSGEVPEEVTKSCFRDLFSALAYLHGKGIIHRDIKPSNLLLASRTGPSYLSDFGTTWHPSFSINDEPSEHKVLEVGTTCYRAPETLFGNRAYDTSLDMWSAGTMLVECLRKPPTTLFKSRETSEDGNQLGLILSMFKTVGTPTEETWPEAKNFSTPPFKWYQEFPGKTWNELLPDANQNARDLCSRLVCFESGNRVTAAEALSHTYLNPK
ncbi:related to cyclin-supressing protein kinase [Rhynchosporium agropyri]|uniref:cyclin-dependent kinase n=1 Tax=Rhynchosporium agropyri TaxID=914238 RepID=A0A1E1LQD9_9HELO|nr:related to cyclin-supressing protein kinase [Rhynchosporium agropyri]